MAGGRQLCLVPIDWELLGKLLAVLTVLCIAGVVVLAKSVTALPDP